MFKRWSEYLNSYAGLLTFLGALLAVFGVGWAIYQQGYSVGKDVFQGRLEEAEKDAGEQKERANIAEAQVTQLRVEVAGRKTNDSSPVEVEKLSDLSKQSNPFVPAPRAAGLRASLEPGNSARLYDGSLIVSLVGIEFGGEPLAYRATMNVVAGASTKPIKAGEVGTQVVVGGRKVTILTVTSAEVTIEVRDESKSRTL